MLHGLIRLYIQTGRSVGSQFLKEQGFDYLSSATIRNYFAQLEQQGYLQQQHTSGGRIPTSKGYRDYVQALLEEEVKKTPSSSKEFLKETKAVNQLLHIVAESLSKESGCAVFLSSPRFDQDFIQKIKLFPLSDSSLLGIIITDFGMVNTEVLYLTHPIEESKIPLLEQFFLWRMNKGEKPSISDPSINTLGKHLYNEIMIRHFASYANFFSEDIYTTGLSKLFNYPEFSQPAILADTLSLFENTSQMQALLNTCIKNNDLTLWIGEELASCASCATSSTVIAVPYHIQQLPVGALGILGPTRLDYERILSLVQDYGIWLSETLTKSVYKFKITFREPSNAQNQASKFITNRRILLEDKSH